MTRKVMVATDGTDKDDRAIAIAAALVELADADARVVRVFSPPVSTLSERAGALGIVTAAHELRDGAMQEVHDAAARLRNMTRHEVTADVIDGLDVAGTLLDEVDDDEPDFVVVATRAAGALGRAFQGSVADKLVRESSAPVVVVPPRAAYLGGKDVTLRRVLVPLDGSDTSLRVIPSLLDLPLASKLEFVLIQAVQPERTGGHAMPLGAPGVDSEHADDEWTHVSAALAQRRLSDIAHRLRERGSHAEIRVVESADAGAVIVDAVRNELVELIAMTTEGASGLRRMILGSVAQDVVRRSEIPVLLVTARSGAPVPVSS